MHGLRGLLLLGVPLGGGGARVYGASWANGEVYYPVREQIVVEPRMFS